MSVMAAGFAFVIVGLDSDLTGEAPFFLPIFIGFSFPYVFRQIAASSYKIFQDDEHDDKSSNAQK